MQTFQEFNEGILDLLTKKGREKRGVEKAEKQEKEKKSEEEKAEIKKMDNLSMKGSGQHTLSPDEKSELSKLRSKYKILSKNEKRNIGVRGLNKWKHFLKCLET